MRVILLALLGVALSGQAAPRREAVVVPFTAEVQVTPGFLDATRTTVVAFLREHRRGKGLFVSVLTERTAGFDGVEIGARLVKFKPGNAALRATVGMGAGRASARFEFTMTDTRKGVVIWRKTIQATAAYFGSSGSSHGQRQELPERIAERLMKDLATARRLTD
jgi:hypothetical protein